MGWKPVHEAHAIDRVHVVVQFNNPLTDKLLAKLTSSVVANFRSLGFEELTRADSAIQNIMVPAQTGVVMPEITQNGWILKRTSADKLMEEAGFRDSIFSYMSTEYGRWGNLVSRFWDIFEAPLETALESVDISSIKLEYWDRFVFDGAPQDADASLLLANIDPTIPASAISGNSLWHSHSGWFENHDDDLILVNRNVGLVDEAVASESRRVCNIFTLVELRPTKPIESVEKSKSTLEHLHQRSLALFGTSLSDEQRDKIGLNLTDYIK